MGKVSCSGTGWEASRLQQPAGNPRHLSPIKALNWEIHWGQEMHEEVGDRNYGFPRWSQQGLICLKEACNICVLLHTYVKPRRVQGEWEHHIAGNAIRGSSTAAVTALRQCCNRDIGSWGSKVRVPACPRSPAATADPSRDGQCPAEWWKRRH